jgi:predicted DCC family thiol-disulfide oxidoreductase YuxK
MLLMSSTFQREATAVGTRRQRPTQLDVFYDSDCGFCTRTARVLRRLDWTHRLRLVSLRNANDVAPDAPSQDRLLASMHARDASGHWFTGGAAWLQIAHLVPLLRPLGMVAELPVIRSLVEPAYTLVARNRDRISHLMGDDRCVVRPPPPERR